MTGKLPTPGSTLARALLVKVVLLLSWALLPGCGPSPPKLTEPGQAREALQQALDAWKGGQEPKALLERKPPVRVLDREWQAGYQLVSYQIGRDDPFAAEVRFQVKLTVTPPGRRAVQKQSVYAVGTSPAVTVVREDEN